MYRFHKKKGGLQIKYQLHVILHFFHYQIFSMCSTHTVDTFLLANNTGVPFLSWEEKDITHHPKRSTSPNIVVILFLYFTLSC